MGLILSTLEDVKNQSEIELISSTNDNDTSIYATPEIKSFDSFPFDPRSPSLGISRTPIQKPISLHSMPDPRSPSIGIQRTPILSTIDTKEENFNNYIKSDSSKLENILAQTQSSTTQPLNSTQELDTTPTSVLTRKKICDFNGSDVDLPIFPDLELNKNEKNKLERKDKKSKLQIKSQNIENLVQSKTKTKLNSLFHVKSEKWKETDRKGKIDLEKSELRSPLTPLNKGSLNLIQKKQAFQLRQKFNS